MYLYCQAQNIFVKCSTCVSTGKVKCLLDESRGKAKHKNFTAIANKGNPAYQIKQLSPFWEVNVQQFSILNC